MPVRESLKEKIAGEICLSDEPGMTIRKWRKLFSVSQKELAEVLDVSPSVISDYEAGRRKSPGIATIRRVVESILEIEVTRGGQNLRRFEADEDTGAIISMGEFPMARSAFWLMELTESECLNDEEQDLDRQIFGYTVVDSIKAVTTFSSNDYMKVYGWSTERALLFSGVHFGRSPMIAIRAHPMKPAVVVYVQPENVDKLAIRLADLERIILLRTEMSVSELSKKMEKFR
ncbi:MAG: helix-turn-helix domain-containing protein [Candidatus Thermoplasmatota archaeon]|nr:helix-turn-helix domain-containing protein [Euryarchaeota archaeon]MBU4032266.1 helix-turn-helix domain-containing protein [Candidatus Thermoplasmatota archaeon]MBU4145257.1 helix-turn-helix domain-containing protein [Candidatus Thermoplasmatota archaeon]MBU4591261.1 helix-turn-helix domain-containing protein [Candidatus Thermoplasmatota archaeon]